MKTLKMDEVLPDLNGMEWCYLHYSIAKKNGLRKGDYFKIDCEDGSVWKIVDHIDWRTDTKTIFRGFIVKEIKN